MSPETTLMAFVFSVMGVGILLTSATAIYDWYEGRIVKNTLTTVQPPAKKATILVRRIKA